jgi:hypothetical protein
MIYEETGFDEQILARVVAEAYLAGGWQRDQLFRTHGPRLSGWGDHADPAVFPYLIAAVVGVSAYLPQFLGCSGSIAEIWSLAREMVRDRNFKPGSLPPAEMLEEPSPKPKTTEAVAVIPANLTDTVDEQRAQRLLTAIIEKMRNAMQPSRLSREKVDAIIGRFLEGMHSDPEFWLEVVKLLSKSR